MRPDKLWERFVHPLLHDTVIAIKHDGSERKILYSQLSSCYEWLNITAMGDTLPVFVACREIRSDGGRLDEGDD